MKPSERDELLVRLDERTATIKETADELKEAVKDANGRQRKTEKKVNTLIAFLVGAGVLTGIGTGVTQLFGS